MNYKIVIKKLETAIQDLEDEIKDLYVPRTLRKDSKSVLIQESKLPDQPLRKHE